MSSDFKHSNALLGRVLADKYALRSEIGKGATGTVFKAEQLSLGRHVAVKILKSELAEDPIFVKRFNDEAMSSSRLNHPHVVSIFDFGQTDDGLLYLVMEYLRGKTLSDLTRMEQLSTKRMVLIASQILSALEDAHDESIVHADLKPDNVMVEVRRDGSDWSKVVDFGIATMVGEQDPQEKDIICGTPDYMAPEVIRGNAPTFAADLYAVGIILYELMTGTTPFIGAHNTIELLRRHIKEEVEPPRERTRAHIDSELEKLVLRALEKKPENRFASAEAFRLALQQIVGPIDTTMETVVCTGCGANASAESKFCSRCGESIKVVDSEKVVVDPTLFNDSETQDMEVFRDELADDGRGLWPLPFVGREPEKEIIRSFMRGERSGVLQISGQAGVGRSRVAQDVSNEMALEGISTFWVGADPTGVSTPFYPIRSLVTALLELPLICDQSSIASALDNKGLSERDCPGIAELLGLQLNLNYLDPYSRFREIVVSASRVLRMATQDTPTAFVFDDVELYDEPSKEFLRSFFALPSVDDQRSITLITERVEKFTPLSTTLTLNPLAEKELERLIDHCRRSPDFRPVRTDVVKKMTGGHPGSIQQWTRMMFEGAHVEHDNEGYATFIENRLGFLDQHAKDILQAASVWGMEIQREDLQSLLNIEAEDERFKEGLEQLVAKEWLLQSDSFVFFGDKIIRDVVYESTPLLVRQELHEETYETLFEKGADPSILGCHAMGAKKHEQAAELLGRGADNFIYQSDQEGAKRLYNLALVSGRRHLMLDNPRSARLRFVSLSIRLAEVLRRSGEQTLARGILVEARDYAREIPELEMQLLRSLSNIAASENKREQAEKYLRSAIGEAMRKVGPETLCELYIDLATLKTDEKDFDGAMKELEEGLSVVTLGEGIESKTPPKMFWKICFKLAQVYKVKEMPRKARRVGMVSLKHAKKENDPMGLARIHSLLSHLCDVLGDKQQATAYQNQAVTLMRHLGDRRGTAEMLLSNIKISKGVARIEPASIQEARLLAEEVGWEDGVRRAKRASGTQETKE